MPEDDNKPQFSITKDDKGGKGLLARVSKIVTEIRKVHTTLHVLAVDCVYHAAMHGDTRPLTALYQVALEKLPNHQTSLRQYIGLIFKQHPEMECMEFKSKEFRMITSKDVSEAKERLAKYCETDLINGTPFFETDNAERAVQLLDDKRLIQQWKSLLNRMNGELETVQSVVDPKLRQLFKKADETISEYAEANGITSEDKKKKAKPATTKTAA